jgi:hypothetical protein
MVKNHLAARLRYFYLFAIVQQKGVSHQRSQLFLMHGKRAMCADELIGVCFLPKYV